jgi:hypothetical protein
MGPDDVLATSSGHVAPLVNWSATARYLTGLHKTRLRGVSVYAEKDKPPDPQNPDDPPLHQIGIQVRPDSNGTRWYLGYK